MRSMEIRGISGGDLACSSSRGGSVLLYLSRGWTTKVTGSCATAASGGGMSRQCSPVNERKGGCE